MYKGVYTKTRDHADEVVAESYEFSKIEDAARMFNERISQLFSKALDNHLLHTSISLHGRRALIKIEDAHHCLAVVDDLNNPA